MDFIIELIGYLGSILVLISMLMSSVIKLRIINTIGSIIFTFYAFVIQTYPTAILNAILVVVNIYNIVKLLKYTKQYDLVEVKAEDSFAEYFLEHYKNDIAVYFPEFKNDASLYDVADIICCNADPAGILLGKKNGEEIEIFLDYTTPMYRDCSVGKFLYAELDKQGIEKLVFDSPSEKHVGYLLKMGYNEESNVYTKEL